MLSDTLNNNLSLSVAKTSTFSRVTLMRAVANEDYVAATAASFTAAVWGHLLDKCKTVWSCLSFRNQNM